MNDYRENYYRKKGWLKQTGLTHDAIADKSFRAGGDCICECGKNYYSHPYADEARDNNDEPYLHVLCNGDIVKL